MPIGNKIRTLVCLAVTGCTVERCELFTTHGHIKIASKATLGISSITPVLNTSEQANRSLVIPDRQSGVSTHWEVSKERERCCCSSSGLSQPSRRVGVGRLAVAESQSSTRGSCHPRLSRIARRTF
jgi:hypothetical protein